MNDKTRWTEADFDVMSWHDCQVNSIALDQDGPWQSDLVLELDFIVEWICRKDKTCGFRVAPALLRFTDVDNLRVDVALKYKDPLEIHWVDRAALPGTAYRAYHWVIKLQSYPGSRENLIEFDAAGFTQELTGRPVETEMQNLTAAQRKESKEGWRTGA